jgi:hypothetical protein
MDGKKLDKKGNKKKEIQDQGPDTLITSFHSPI